MYFHLYKGKVAAPLGPSLKNKVKLKVRWAGVLSANLCSIFDEIDSLPPFCSLSTKAILENRSKPYHLNWAVNPILSP